MSDDVFCVLSGTRSTSVIRLGWPFASMILRSLLMAPGLVQTSPLFAADCSLPKETTNCGTWCMIGHRKDQVLMIFIASRTIR